MVERPAKEETHERATFFCQPETEAVGTHVRRQRKPDLVSRPSARRLFVVSRCAPPGRRGRKGGADVGRLRHHL